MRVRLWWLIVLFASPGLWAGGIDDVKAALATPGKAHLEFEVSTGDLKTTIPLTVITGPEVGPTLLALAGIHGSEYSPIIATQRLAQELSPEELAGSLILVHAANLPAYLGRTIYVSPADGKNLNRLFPGDATGTLSNRIAHVLAEELFPLADAVLDMHSGDGNEQLRPSWTGYYAKVGSAEVVAASRALALAFGLPHIVEFQWELKGRESAIWAGSAAVAQGIASIDVEAGGMGIIDPLAIEQIRTGVKRVLAHLGMIEMVFKAPPTPVFIRDRTSIRSPVDGSWNPLVDAGTRVEEGQKLGVVTDWYGRPVFEAIAPADGLLLLRLEAPPVRRGETLIMIAKVP
ncbi:MAG: M14 family metallopeptidase [Pseudomonadota bacterium]